MKFLYKKLILTVLLVLSSVGLNGCIADSTTIVPNQRHIISDKLAIPGVTSAAGSFNSRVIFMADQLERNLDRKNLANTFIVTSFANLNRLSETTSFGRLIAENLIHELQVRKWQVFEVRLTRDIIINETGEFSLSRDIKKLKDQYKIGGIVTGTYTVTGNNIIVNARVIDINTGVVVSSGQSHIPVNWFTDNLLYSDDNYKVMKVVGDTPYSCRELGTCTATTPFLPSYSKTPGTTP